MSPGVSSICFINFCQAKVIYVGHIVSAEGVANDPVKVNAVTNWPQSVDQG